MNGVLVIDKPKGWTSHDVVAAVRTALRLRKAGHGGTLDPLATGVLPIYLEEGTKLVPFNLEGTKEYQATMKLGQETDTLDAGGKIIAERKNFFCTPGMVEETLKHFRGTILQAPPLFSAVKYQGKPLYQRARAGEAVELAERKVLVHNLELRDFSFPLVTLRMTCGRGTYVRSLCADVGRALGCGAHVVELRRLRSGMFTLHEALTMEDLEHWGEKGRIGEKVIPLRQAVALSGEIMLDERTAQKVRNGRTICAADIPEMKRKALRKGEQVGLVFREELLALARCEAEGEEISGNPQVLRTLRVFQRN